MIRVRDAVESGMAHLLAIHNDIIATSTAI